MATEYMLNTPMYDPSMMGGGYHPGSGGTNGYSYSQKVPNGRNFAFRKRFERVDWRKVASIDIEHISRTLDFNALQENILNITFCNIEAELVSCMYKLIEVYVFSNSIWKMYML